jgi:serine protease Do
MRIDLAIGTALLAATLVVPGASAQTTTVRPRRVEVITNANAPYLGIGVKDIDQESAKKLNLKDVRGVEITQVEDNSPAAKAGIKEGDVVLEYNGQPVEGGEQLSRFVRETPIGRQVKIGVWRNGSMQTLSASVEAHKNNVWVANGNGSVVMPEIHIPEQLQAMRIPNVDGMTGFGMVTTSPMLGIIGESLSSEEQLAEFFGVKEGVLVKSVNKNSAAEKAGIKAGDVIVKVDDEKVGTSREITSALRSARSKKSVTVIVVRAKKEMPVTVTIESSGSIASPVRAGFAGPRYFHVDTTHGDSVLFQ